MVFLDYKYREYSEHDGSTSMTLSSELIVQATDALVQAIVTTTQTVLGAHPFRQNTKFSVLYANDDGERMAVGLGSSV